MGWYTSWPSVPPHWPQWIANRDTPHELWKWWCTTGFGWYHGILDVWNANNCLAGQDRICCLDKITLNSFSSSSSIRERHAKRRLRFLEPRSKNEQHTSTILNTIQHPGVRHDILADAYFGDFDPLPAPAASFSSFQSYLGVTADAPNVSWRNWRLGVRLRPQGSYKGRL